MMAGDDTRLPRKSAIQVPTAKERTGNFSDWPYPLYDPTTTVCTIRLAMPLRAPRLPGNQIPSSEIYSMGQKLANLYPLPNINCTHAMQQLRCAGTQFTITTNNEIFRVDQNFGDKDRVYFTGIWQRRRTSAQHAPLLGSKKVYPCPTFWT